MDSTSRLLQACHVTKKPRQVYLPPTSTGLQDLPFASKQILPLMKPQNLHNCQHESLPGHSGQPSDGSGPSNLASAQISSSTRANFPDRHANDKGDNGKAWTKHWASTSQIFRWIAIFWDFWKYDLSSSYLLCLVSRSSPDVL